MKKYILAIDLGGTNTKLGLFSISGDLIYKTQFTTPSKEKPKNFFELLEKEIDAILKKYRITEKNIKAIGMGSPGPVDIKNGIMLHSANFPQWKNVNYHSFFKEKYGIDSFFDNDVNLVGLGEYYKNLKDKYSYILILTLGTGVGGAYIENGKILTGAGGYGGEFGHISIVPNGIKCGCGSKGCLEAYVSASGIRKRLKLLENQSNIKKNFLKQLSDYTPKSVYELAENGNKYAIEFLKETGYYLGIGLKNFVNIFNPEIILIGGGMYKSLKYILPEAKKYVKNNAFKEMTKKLIIKTLKLSQNSALYGGYIIAKREIS